jgi:acylphosphatase
VSPSHTAVHLLIQGRVQGVGFRFFAQETAEALSVSGWVRNLPDGSVEVYGEGICEVLEDWVRRLRQGPPLARVDRIQTDWPSPQGVPQTFSIR